MGVSIWEGNKAQSLIDAGNQIVAGIARQNLLLSQMVPVSEATPAAELAEIHRIVQAGEAPSVFNIGDQLMLNYNDGEQAYVLPWDIVHFGNVELQDGESVPGMFLQSHYAMQLIQFDASEAIYVATAAMAPGTYYFTIGSDWGNCKAGDTFSFTTTIAIPSGGQVVIGANTDFYSWSPNNTATSNWQAYTFANAASTTPLERPLALTAGATGTSLGTVSVDIVYGTSNPNNLQRAGNGYSRWSQTGARQWLNSKDDAGRWWTAQNVFDRPPQQLATMRGFMAGFDDAFLSIIKPVKITTDLSPVTDAAFGTSEDTFDTFFPASLCQEYFVPQQATDEEYWEYWKQRTGLKTPQRTGTSYTNAYRARYAYNAKTTAQITRLRNVSLNNAYGVWYVSVSGASTSVKATTPYRVAPACVIC